MSHATRPNTQALRPQRRGGFTFPTSFPSFFVRFESPFLRSLITRWKASPFCTCLSSLFPQGHFFCSTAPQAFFRPNRNSHEPARAGHVKAGRFSAATVRLGLYMTEHDGRLVGLGRKAPPSVRVLPSGIANLCRLHRSLRGRMPLAASWAFEGFGAAMSRTGSPRCRGRNRAVAEARPGRDDVSP